MQHQYPASDDFLSILRTERRDLIERLRKTRFTTLKQGYSYAQLVPHASYAPWLDDQRFNDIYATIQSHTLVDIYRCYELYLCATQVEQVPGDLVEVGVWRGGTAALVASVLPGKQMHLFDTFAGVAKADGAFDTLYSGGEHADTATDIVEQLFSAASRTARFHVGIFPDDTLGELPETVAMAHIDVDTYGSAKESFRAIWPRVQAGGMLIFDDYGFFGCEGVAQAVTELRGDLDDAVFVHNLNGHGLFIKK